MNDAEERQASFTVQRSTVAPSVRWPRRTVLLGMLMAAVVRCESEADRVEERLEELSRELPLQQGESKEERRRRLEKRLGPALTEDVELLLSWEEGLPRARSFVLTAATELRRIAPVEDVRLTSVAVELDDEERRAVATGQANVSSSQPGDLHAGKVRFEVSLVRRARTWKIERIVLASPRQELPEARP